MYVFIQYVLWTRNIRPPHWLGHFSKLPTALLYSFSTDWLCSWASLDLKPLEFRALSPLSPALLFYDSLSPSLYISDWPLAYLAILRFWWILRLYALLNSQSLSYVLSLCLTQCQVHGKFSTKSLLKIT